MIQYQDQLPPEFEEQFTKTMNDQYAPPDLRVFVNLNLHINNVFGPPLLAPMASDLIVNYFELPDINLYDNVLNHIDRLQQNLWPDSIFMEREALPWFFPPEFTHFNEAKWRFNKATPLEIRSNIWEVLFTLGFTEGDLFSENLIQQYAIQLDKVGHDPGESYKWLSELRAEILPPDLIPELDANLETRSRIVQFLMTPYDLARKLPQNFRDDLVRYFHASEQPNYHVSFPGWDEIIKIFPTVVVTAGEKKAWNEWRRQAAINGVKRMGFDPDAFKRATFLIGPPPLDEFQIEFMRKRWLIAKRINLSPTPDTVRTIGDILTFFDDIQDGLVTLTYLGRVGVFLLGKIGPRLAFKAIPIVGWVSVAKDLMDITTYVRALRVARKDNKRHNFDALEIISRSRAKGVRHYKKLKKMLPTYREAIQIAQTTEVFFETGLALGPIVGVVEDIFFGLFTGAKYHFLDWTYNFGGLYQEVLPIQQVGIESPNITGASFQCFRIIGKASKILPFINHLDPSDVLNIFTALHYAWVYLAASGDLKDWDVWQHKVIDLEIKPKPHSWSTKEVLSQISDYPDSENEPISSTTNTHTTTPRLLSKKIQNDFRKEFPIFMERHKHDNYSKYISILMEDIVTNYLYALNGEPFEIEEKLTPFASATMLIFHYALENQLPENPELQLSLVSEIADRIIYNFGKWPPFPEIEALFQLYSKL